MFENFHHSLNFSMKNAVKRIAMARFTTRKGLVFKTLMGVAFSGMLWPVFASAQGECLCPPVECDPCEQQESVQFYTQKCEQGEQLKSCAKAKCVPKKPLPMHCRVAASSKKQESKKSTKSSDRMPASLKKLEHLPLQGDIAGTVTAVSGQSWVSVGEGKKSSVQLNMPIHTLDQIETEIGGQVQVDFNDGSRILIFENSVIRLSIVEKQKSNIWNQLLDLFQGKVRNQTADGQNKFQVRTKHAVVGGAGADFFVNHTEGDRAVTKVQTLKGQVELSSRDGEQKIEVKNGESSSFVVTKSPASVFTEDELSEFVAQGYMTPIYKMKAKELDQLKKQGFVDSGSARLERGLASTSAGFKKTKSPAAPENFICSQPTASFNQCSWECVGNPKGSKACRGELPQVRCVRRRCNANGMWADEIPLPAIQADKCIGNKVKVDTCDY
ncbi:MAG: FecR domain-containing protein [Bdellovibrionales bacterium]|nr:FecR domain-containing protein [Bdellovibrionales bacterium]